MRKFGLVVGGVFAALGLLFLARGKPFYPWVLGPGVGLMGLGAVWPAGLKFIYLGWMALALALGFVVSNVILGLFFFLVITPIGLVARMFGKDFLRLKLDRNAPTYWMARPKRAKTPADYEQQF